ncbi:MAG TPA: hypothetical protein VF432_03970 [Thermoanaerobaculia bacterium]
MTDDDDKFFERLRGDAASLRHRVDDATLARIHARIRERIAPKPTVADVLASWFRPLAAGLTALALAAAIGLTVNVSEGSFDEEQVEIVMGGDTYRVGD